MGSPVACAIFDECAYWRDELSANPDVEVLAALTPSMITLHDAGAMLIGMVLGAIIAFAATFNYRPNRDCYVGVAEFSVYVDRAGRGRGAGRAAMQALISAAAQAGFWKLLSRVFPENTASLGLLRSCGFRDVGVYQKHGKRDGVWKDVVIVERLLEDEPVR